MKKKIYLILIPLLVVMVVYVAWVSKNNDILSGSNNSKNSFGSTLNKEPEQVSVIQLIAEPEKYDGKFVRVIGVSCIEFEGNALYLSKDDYKYNITMNSISMDLKLDALGTSLNELKKFNGHYVLIEGTFNKSKTGHLGIFNGGLENITRFSYMENIIHK